MIQLEELDELGGGDAHQACGFGDFAVVAVDAVEGFRQQDREVLVVGVDGEFLFVAAGPPQVTRFVARFAADLKGQSATQPNQRLAVVGLLLPLLVRFGHHAGRTMREFDRRGRFVAMLPPRTGPPQLFDVALREQCFIRQTGGMRRRDPKNEQEPFESGNGNAESREMGKEAGEPSLLRFRLSAFRFRHRFLPRHGSVALNFPSQDRGEFVELLAILVGEVVLFLGIRF